MYMDERRLDEKDIDRIFRTAAFGMRSSHKEELKRRLFTAQGEEDELSEDELFSAAGGNRPAPDVPFYDENGKGS